MSWLDRELRRTKLTLVFSPPSPILFGIIFTDNICMSLLVEYIKMVHIYINTSKIKNFLK